MIDRIYSGNILLAVILPAEGNIDGIDFVTADDSPFQLASMRYEKGKQIQPHVHNNIPRAIETTSETLFIKKGSIRIDFFDDNRNYLESRIVREKDVVLLLGGGHAMELLEDADFVEVKQGPYLGDDDKVKFSYKKEDGTVCYE